MRLFSRNRDEQAADHHAGCAKHPLEHALGPCSRCQRACCEHCLLDVRGRALCIDCGLVLAGVTARRR